MNQEQLKALVGKEAADYARAHVPRGGIIGVGTGTTANCFIDALAAHRTHFRGALSSSAASTERLTAIGIAVLDPNQVATLELYVDGADEIDPAGHMIKGGGGALTREKIVAELASTFLCIADGSKRVDVLGRFALPIEVVPLARALIERRASALGGRALLRTAADGQDYLTDNGNHIVDVAGLHIDDPQALEREINAWPGVVTVGLFARRHANLAMFATANGVETVRFQAVGGT